MTQVPHAKWMRYGVPLALLLAAIPFAVSLGFTLAHRSNTLVSDDWCGIAEVVVSAIDGRFAPALLFEQHNIHRPVTLYAFTLLSYSLTGWNREVDILFSFALALLNVVLLVDLLRRDHPRWLPFAIVICAALLFALRLRDIWMWSALWAYLMGWTPILIGLWFVRRLRAGWLPLLIALVGVLTATFSLMAGWLGWLALPLVFWLRGYRKWTYFAVWAGAFVLTIGVYFAGFQTDSAQIVNFCQGWQIYHLEDVSLVTRLTTGTVLFLTHLTAPFMPGAPDQINPARPLGALLLVFIALNGVYWLQRLRRDQRWAEMAIIIGVLLYGLGAAAMTVYGRLTPITAFNSGYHLSIATFWAVFLVASIGAIGDLWRETGTRWRALIYVNSLMLVALAGLYGYANWSAADLRQYPADAQPYTHVDVTYENCMAAVPFAGTACLYDTTFGPEPDTVYPTAYMMQRLAETRTLTFGEITAVLPPDYTPGEPVLIAAAPAVQHPIVGYTNAGRLERIPESAIYHALDAAQTSILAPHTAAEQIIAYDSATLQADLSERLRGYETLWLLAMDDAVGESALAALESASGAIQRYEGDWWRRQFDVVAQVSAPMQSALAQSE